MTEHAKYPHCDELVLHAPGACEFCDLYPEHQEARRFANVNFTGQHDPSKQSCPSEKRRPLRDIERWPGNRPKRKS